MGQFLYFKPNGTEQDATRKALQASPLGVPLRDLLRSAKLYEEQVCVNYFHNAGPGGAAGIMVNVADQSINNPQQACFEAQHQRWEPIDGGWMIGIDERHKPDEVSLRRQHTTAGYDVLLSDGVAWKCPILRAWDKARQQVVCKLPSVWGFKDGQPQLIVRDEFSALWERSEQFMKLYLHGGSVDFVDCLNFAAECLAINYRIGPTELAMLQVATPEEVDRLWQAACDIPLIEQTILEQSQNPKDEAPAPD